MKTQMSFLILQVRHNIRPHFLVSDSHKCVYDVITWACTQIAISYTVVPFVLLAVGSSLKFYRYVFMKQGAFEASSLASALVKWGLPTAVSQSSNLFSLGFHWFARLVVRPNETV